MMSRLVPSWWILVVLALVLYGCAVNPAPEPPTTPPALVCRNGSDVELQPPAASAGDLRPTRPQVAALGFSPDDSSLWIAYAFDSPDVPGLLTQVQLSDKQAVRSVTLGRLTTGLTRLTHDGARIVSAAPKTCTLKPVFPGETCWDVPVWETASGQPIAIPEDSSSYLHDIAISGDGIWFLRVELQSPLTSFDPWRGGATVATPITLGLHTEAVAGALSEHANFVVLGFEETSQGKFVRGVVRLNFWDGNKLRSTLKEEGWSIGLRDLTWEGLEVDGAPLGLTFAPKDYWLAAQTKKSIYLYDMPSLGGVNSRVDFLPAERGVMAFNPSGSLLAAGHSKGLRLLRVPSMETVLDKASAPPTAVAFSPDGCLLASGDVEGVVHITSSPEP